MRAASRDALATSHERLEQLVADADDAVTERVADELGAVADLLAGQVGLRRALADSSRTHEAREGLVNDLFGSQLAEPTLKLLRGLATSRWSAPHDLIDAAELASVEATLAAAERAGKLADVEDELFRFARIAEANSKLTSELEDGMRPVRKRIELAEGLLRDKVAPQTLKLVARAVTGLGGRPFSAGLDRLVELAAERRNRSVARVRVATAMTDEQESRLAGSLRRIYGRDISVLVEIDESIIGGAVVAVGDDLYDGSILRRITEARNGLTR
ncbi:F0F1 ATP synthase subunit delta [Fodinicola feengrottensis]|uniref:ATP synthase subunit delta n=1 Tax=Fodinicola feengrottensis TaxID=435914 RepID=A0ABP4RSS0_9ACTN|nr:F0F1 ATP synthase subunit delta [Fodinicola feengrottensis]